MSLKPRHMNFNETWDHLQKTVKKIMTLEKLSRSTWIENDIFHLCVALPEPQADILFSNTKLLLVNHVKELLDKVLEDGDLILLESYYEAWTQYYQGCNHLHKFYSYFNQQIVKNYVTKIEIIYGKATLETDTLMEIGELGFEIWNVYMIGPLQQKLVNQILLGINQDRVGGSTQFSSTLICGVIESFVLVQDYKIDNLDLYKEIFEEPFLKASGEYFQQESNRLFPKCNINQYIEKAIPLIDEEILRSKKFLHSSSHEKARAKCEQYMVSAHLDVLHGEFQQMLFQERRRELTILYTFVKNVPGGLPPLVDDVFNYIKQHVLKALLNNSSTTLPVVPASADAKNSPYTQFVGSILPVHKKFKQMIQEVFIGDKSLFGALDKACAFVMNHKTNPNIPCPSSELFAKYYDILLKKSLKGISESEIEEKLSQSIKIFKYIDDKDIFQKNYARMLAKRLIYQQSNSLDAEKAMINRLKVACGYAFTIKLTQMLKDISLSADLNNKFNNCMRDRNIELGINFSIYVLQVTAWPFGQSAITPFVVPQEVERALQLFEKVYHEKFNCRKLTWLHHLCEGELKLTYLKKPYLITMHTFQMAILLLFEKNNSLTGKELQKTLQLNDDVFAKHAASLVACKLLISNTPNILSETVLSLNMKYSNKRTKLKISGALQRDPTQEVEHTMGLVDEERKFYLKATIVRIMKRRKLLKHNQLIQKVLSQTKVSFAPSITMIKKCIEALIDKDYIARNPNSSDEYSYIT